MLAPRPAHMGANAVSIRPTSTAGLAAEMVTGELKSSCAARSFDAPVLEAGVCASCTLLPRAFTPPTANRSDEESTGTLKAKAQTKIAVKPSFATGTLPAFAGSRRIRADSAQTGAAVMPLGALASQPIPKQSKRRPPRRRHVWADAGFTTGVGRARRFGGVRLIF